MCSFLFIKTFLFLITCCICFCRYKKVNTKKVDGLKKINSIDLNHYQRFSFGFDPGHAFDIITKVLSSDKVPVFIYGSLISINAAQLSLKHSTIDQRKLMRAVGAKRLFNRDIASCTEAYFSVSKEEKAHPLRRASANLQLTGNLMDFANGAVYMMDRNEFMRVFNIEDGYGLIPILVSEWDSKCKNTGNFYLAYTFCAEESIFLNKCILPRSSYYARCR